MRGRSIAIALGLILVPSLVVGQTVRRRPSMVGYVGDATIASQVRVRFDAGSGIDAVDRAEFFYGKCGCYRGLPTNHPGYDPDAPGPGPGVVTDLDFRQLNVLAEIAAIPDRLSIFAEVPFRWIRPQAFVAGTGSFPNQSGLSDVRVGSKLAVVSTALTTLSLFVQAALPTGKSEKGLGTDHVSIEPALLLHQTAGERLAVEAQFGGVIPLSSSAGVPTATGKDFAGNILYYGIGPSLEVTSGDSFRLAPVAELVGWRVLSGHETASGKDISGLNIVNLKLGGRLVFGGRTSFYAGYGFALTDAKWYDKILRVEFRQSL